MTTWSVALKSAGEPEPGRDLLTEMEDLAEILDERSGVVSATETTTEARFDVEAFDVIDAALQAKDLFFLATDKVGMPSWPIVRVEAMPISEQEIDLAIPNYPTLLGVAELADTLGVSRQRASELASSSRFPQPFTKLASGPVWDKHAVDAFIETWERRPGRPSAVLE